MFSFCIHIFSWCWTCYSRPKPFQPSAEVLALAEKLPASFDWRDVNGMDYVSPVRNQGIQALFFFSTSISLTQRKVWCSKLTSVSLLEGFSLVLKLMLTSTSADCMDRCGLVTGVSDSLSSILLLWLKTAPCWEIIQRRAPYYFNEISLALERWAACRNSLIMIELFFF